jgi:transcription antitermination protein NusB
MQETNNDPRHQARIIALQRLFEKDYQVTSKTEEHGDFFNNTSLTKISGTEKFDKQLAALLYKGVLDHQVKIDQIILKLAPEWPIANIAKIDVLILRMAVLEGFILKLTPQKVVIDEAIELAKEFSNDQTRKFVSGVLGNLFTNQNKYLS